MLARRKTRGTQFRAWASLTSVVDAFLDFGLTFNDINIIEEKNPGFLKSNVETVSSSVPHAGQFQTLSNMKLGRYWSIPNPIKHEAWLILVTAFFGHQA